MNCQIESFICDNVRVSGAGNTGKALSLKGATMTPPPPQYIFPRNIELNPHPSMTQPCWEWQQHRDNDGYGIINLKGKNEYVHRLFYRLFVDNTAFGRVVMHKCDNPPCCNPEHLYLGTTAQNIADRNAKFRHAFGINSGSAKLNDEKVATLRRRYEAGESSPRLAKETGVSTSTMQNVLFGRTWIHVPGACKPRSVGSRGIR